MGTMTPHDSYINNYVLSIIFTRAMTFVRMTLGIMISILTTLGVGDEVKKFDNVGN
jgi:hypothetical protein